MIGAPDKQPVIPLLAAAAPLSVEGLAPAVPCVPVLGFGVAAPVPVWPAPWVEFEPGVADGLVSGVVDGLALGDV